MKPNQVTFKVSGRFAFIHRPHDQNWRGNIHPDDSYRRSIKRHCVIGVLEALHPVVR